MKVNENFRLRKVGAKTVAVSVGGACKKFKGSVKLNDTARFIWESMFASDSENETIQKMVDNYELTTEHARTSYDAMVEHMAAIGAVTTDD